MAIGDYRRRLLHLIVLVIFLGSLVEGEIHRAKSLNSRPRPNRHLNQYPLPLWPPNYAPGHLLSLQPSRDIDGNETETSVGAQSSWMLEVILGHEIQTWVYSIASACLVGLSGIFPLVVIPIEAGRSLRSGAANDRLKLLLSFAVGGLLGDVFLHLLPETWAHLQQLGGDRKAHTKIGLWLLTGLLSFFIIQKIFPESEEEEQEEENDTRREGQQKSALPSDNICTAISNGTKGKRKQKDHSVTNGAVNGKKTPKKPPGKNGFCRVTASDGTVVPPSTGKAFSAEKLNNGKDSLSEESSDSDWIDSFKNWVLGGTARPEPQKSHIKTSGWLNLMANMIDNFTHGLAVAGSYSISIKTGLLTTVAILLHEIPHEIGDFAILLKAGFDRWKAAKAQLLTATGGMFGALIALAAESTKEAGESTAWILPFTAGGFIYIALVTVVPDLLKETNPWHSLKQLVFLGAGISTMAVVSTLVD